MPRIYDNGGRSFNRYTVFVTDDFVLGIGDTGNVPNGFCMTVDAVEGPHLGEQITLDAMTGPARDAVYAAITEAADEEGYRYGTAAGSWVVDGNTSEETARRLLRGLEEGDPEILDELPSAPLSGEFADGLLPRDVLGWYELADDDDAADDVLSAFEEGYSRGVIDEVERAARAMLPDPDEAE